MLGDCYGAAVVEALSKKELEAMDKEAEKERRKELEEDLERGHETIVKKCKQVKLKLVMGWPRNKNYICLKFDINYTFSFNNLRKTLRT